MTSPQPEPDTQGLSNLETAAVAALATALLEGSLVAGTAVPPYLLMRLTSAGADRRAARAAIRLGLSEAVHIPSGTVMQGTASALVAAAEPRIRARYIFDAAKRITKNLVLVGTDPGGMITAVRDERRYLRQHLAAGQNRRRAAHAVDRAAGRSPWLVWTTQGDSKVEADCRALAGRLFTAAQPLIVHGRPVFPGSLHPHCRCVARAPGSSPIRATPTAS